MRFGGGLTILHALLKLHGTDALRVAGGSQCGRSNSADAGISRGGQRRDSTAARRQRSDAAIGLEVDVNRLRGEPLRRGPTLGGQLDLALCCQRGVLQRSTVLRVLEVHVLRSEER